MNKAASDRLATVPFFLCKPNDALGSLFPTLRAHEFTAPVETITIDEFLAGQPVDVVKMDIEGGEPYALEGMKKTLSENKNIVFFVEFNGPSLQRAGVSPEDFLAQLDNAGFVCQLINEELRCLQPIKPDVVLRKAYCNLYCIREATTE